MKARPPPLLLLSAPLPQSSKTHKKGWGQMAGVEGWTVSACDAVGHRGTWCRWGRWQWCTVRV